MTSYAWRPLGDLLVERGLIDPYDLEIALLEQKMTGQLLGELLVARKLVSPIDLAAVLAANHGVMLDRSAAPPGEAAAVSRPRGGQGWRPLGRILVERGQLTESGLQRALLAQRQSGSSLGEILVQRRYITPAELAAALAEQQGLSVHPEVLETALEIEPPAKSAERYELREIGRPGEPTVYVGQSFLDATDFAFELIHSSNPEALEIVRIQGHREEPVWTYTRAASEAFRAETAEQRKRFTPLMYQGGNGDSPNGSSPAA